jgi:hypothetical protein
MVASKASIVLDLAAELSARLRQTEHATCIFGLFSLLKMSGF